MKNFVFFVFCLFLIHCASARVAQKRRYPFAVGPTDQVIEGLQNYQSINGGFFDDETNQTPTISATYDALVLGSIFSLPNINRTLSLEFLESLRNVDGGFSDSIDSGSSVEGTKSAVAAYASIGLEMPNSDGVISYFEGVFSDDGFIHGSDGRISLSDTLAGVQSLLILQRGEKEGGDWIEKAYNSISKALEESLVVKDQVRYFEFDSSKFITTDSLTDNFYAIELAHTGFIPSSLSEHAEYFVRLQADDGCFYPTEGSSTTSSQHVLLAVRALNSLKHFQQENSQLNFVELLNTQSLIQCVQSNLQPSISSITEYALTFSFSGFYQQLFEFEFDYRALNAPSVDAETVIQGTQISPRFVAGTRYGLHALLELRVQFQLDAASPELFQLYFDRQSASYVVVPNAESIAFDTADQLGALQIVFFAQQYIPTIGALRFYAADQKLVGYGMNVEAEAHSNGVDVNVGDQVDNGADFSFDLSLFVQGSDEQLDLNEFEIEFVVVDSSGLLVHHDVVGSGDDDLEVEDEDNEDDVQTSITIPYSLQRSNIPAGNLDFIFQIDGVRQDGSTFTHTRHRVSYELKANMVASQVSFEISDSESNTNAKLGDVIVARMTPGNAPSDFSSIEYYQKAQNNDQRSFFLDLVSSQGNVVQSVRAQSSSLPLDGSEDGVQYQFEFQVSPAVQSIGSFSFQFRYISQAGSDFVLYSLDQSDDQSQTTTQHSIDVNANLVLQSQSPIDLPKEVSYGYPIELDFSVEDSVSSSRLTSFTRSASSAGIYLVITNSASGKSSVHQAINSNPQGKFSLKWNLPLDAISGSSVLTVQAENSDGEVIQVLQRSTDQTPLSFNVEIGGSIDSQSDSYSTSTLTAKKTAFLTTFSLSCNDRPLSGATLFASVYRDNKKLNDYQNLPVALSGSSYSLSWTMDVEDASTGLYEIRLFREADVTSQSSQPVLVVSIPHSNLGDRKLPVRAEYLVLIVLTYIYYRLYTKFPILRKKTK